MPLPSLFRLSFFVTLALACITLTVANLFFLPLLPIFLLGVLTLIGYAWHLRERWQLSEQAANHLGILIALGTLGWILFQLPRSEDDLVAGGVSYPAGLLPHLGPLLMLLLCVKIFRPMYLADFWSLQTIGLMMTTLGCVLANDPAFGIALILYLASLVWCLMLFYHHRESLLVKAGSAREPLFSSGTPPNASDAKDAATWRWFGAPLVGRRFVGVLFMGMVFFFLAPRFSNLHWEPKALSLGKAPTKAFRTGIDEGMDLNRVGKVELSEDPAFFVQVSNAKGISEDFPSEPRWTLQTLDLFERGRWRSLSDAIESPTGGPNVRSRIADPEMPTDPDYLTVAFKLQTRDAGGLPLLDPPNPRYSGFDAMINDNRPPLGTLFFYFENADVVAHIQSKFRGIYRYQQFVRRSAVSQNSRDSKADEDYLKYLLDQRVPKSLAPLAWELANRVCDPAPPAPNDDHRADYAPEHHEKIARTLCNHFAHSGEYEYSLDLYRQDLAVDPTTDFLKNIKKGHCERFASSLALVLRSLGIPSRVVKGYRGADLDESTGGWIVRQSQAHSWVEVLLTPERPWRWVVLDPTPSNESVLASQKTIWEWLQENTPTPASFWRDYVMRMNSDSQMLLVEFLVRAIRPHLGTIAGGAGVLLVLGMAVWWGRYWLRYSPGMAVKPKDPQEAWPEFYEKWLNWLRTHWEIEPSPNETPLEFAKRVEILWAKKPETQGWTERPTRVAHAYNLHRFGGGPAPLDLISEVARWTTNSAPNPVAR